MENLELEKLTGKRIQLVVSVDDLVEFGKTIESRIISSFTNQFDKKLKSKDDELLTFDEAAKYLKKSRTTLHSWKKRGLIPYIRISNKIYFKKSDLIDSHKVIHLKKGKA